MIDFGPIDGSTDNNSRSWQHTVSGTFTDGTLFSLTQFSVPSAGLANAAAKLFIDDLTQSFSGGNVAGPATLLLSATWSSCALPPGVQNVDLSRLREGPAAQYLAVGRMTLDSPSSGGSLSVAVSPVPLPPSAPLFGAAVLALGLAAYRLRSRETMVPARADDSVPGPEGARSAPAQPERDGLARCLLISAPEAS